MNSVTVNADRQREEIQVNSRQQHMMQLQFLQVQHRRKQPSSYTLSAVGNVLSPGKEICLASTSCVSDLFQTTRCSKKKLQPSAIYHRLPLIGDELSTRVDKDNALSWTLWDMLLSLKVKVVVAHTGSMSQNDDTVLVFVCLLFGIQ